MQSFIAVIVIVWYVVGCWRGYLRGLADLHMAQLMPLPLTVSCFSKIQMVSPFWYRLTRVVPDKGPLNRCVCCHHIVKVLVAAAVMFSWCITCEME